MENEYIFEMKEDVNHDDYNAIIKENVIIIYEKNMDNILIDVVIMLIDWTKKTKITLIRCL